jgi:glucokinase
MDFCGGIDIGGTKLASALFAASGELAARDKVPIDGTGGDAVAAQVADRIVALSAAARTAGGRLLAVGICVPGIAYPAEGKVWAPNIPGWDQYRLMDSLMSDPRLHGEYPGSRPRRPKKPESHPDISQNGGSEPLRRHSGAPLRGLRSAPVPLILESDRSAYVAGEAWRGAAAGARDAVFLAVGTGIGAGIISGGRILHGHEDIAGAVGWFALDPDFKPAYAAMGCFEAEASGGSVARKARARLEQEGGSAMLGLAGGAAAAVTAEIVAAAARRGDALALEIVGGAVTYLAMGIANIVSLLNPEVVVLGGGLFQAADVFLEPVRREFQRWAQPLAARSVRIEPSALGEDAGLYGCGKLAWERVGTGTEGPCPPETR